MENDLFINRDEKSNITISQAKKDGFSIGLNPEELTLAMALFDSPKIKTILQKCAEAGYYFCFQNTHPSPRRD